MKGYVIFYEYETYDFAMTEEDAKLALINHTVKSYLENDIKDSQPKRFKSAVKKLAAQITDIVEDNESDYGEIEEADLDLHFTP